MFTASTETKTGKDGKSTFDVLRIKYKGISVQEIYVNDQMRQALIDIDKLIESFEKGGK